MLMQKLRDFYDENKSCNKIDLQLNLIVDILKGTEWGFILSA